MKLKFLIATLVMGINIQSLCTANIEEEIPCTEDLMQEHGVLNRVLLIYEEIIRRIDDGEFPIKALAQAVTIIQDFIQNHHEKLEENYIFPLFEKQHKELDLVKTLRKQHNKGREITAELLDITKSTKPADKNTKKRVKNLLKKFIRMYRPHEARENTILLPQVRSLISEKEFDELGETFEEIEHKLFGEDAFTNFVKQVASIEKELDIYNLEHFTP